MFTGIIEEIAQVESFASTDGKYRLVVKSKLDHSSTELGDSIAINGVCLTVVSQQAGRLSFDLCEETLAKTSLGKLAAGSSVNLERSLKVGDRLGGHFVSGHIDTTVALSAQERLDGSLKLSFEMSQALKGFLVTKGSVCLDGVSLTVAEASPGNFDLYIVPHTEKNTTLGNLAIGQEVNVEIDMLARYVDSLIADRGQCLMADRGQCQNSSVIDYEFLKEHGYA